MVVYEVNLEINSEIYEQFQIWLIKHVKAMLKFEGFIEVKILVEHTEQKANKKITCCYLVASPIALNHYLTNHAAAMRQDGINEFGDAFSATRRIFDVMLIQPKQ